MGLQEIRRVLKINPQSGQINTFDKAPIGIGFQSKISDDQRIWVKNFAISSQETEDIKDKEFKYTSTFIYNFGNI